MNLKPSEEKWGVPAFDVFNEPEIKCSWCFAFIKNTPRLYFGLPFCNYGCGFRWIFHNIYGIVIKAQNDYCKGVGLIQIPYHVLESGWDNETLRDFCLNAYPSVFSKLQYQRQNWAFQVSKLLMQQEDFS